MAIFIFVTGGVCSGLGKGIAAASIGVLLKGMGRSVNVIKCDPYLNIDPGVQSPIEHGEVFVTDDGAEADLDLGHYERFLDICTSKISNVTTGQAYQSVLDAERRGDYLGKTVQIIPHLTNEIQRRITAVGKGFDFVIVEIGGTVGDVESQPFLEAIRQLSKKEKSIFVHLTLLPYLAFSDEIKTKPTQHSVRDLRQLGIQPDILICRCPQNLADIEKENIRKKVSLFCDVNPEAIIFGEDVDSIYQVPTRFYDQNLHEVILKILNLPSEQALSELLYTMQKWGSFDIDHRFRTKSFDGFTAIFPNPKVSIAICGKYTLCKDSYISIAESLHHAAKAVRVDLQLDYVNLEEFMGNPEDTEDRLKKYDGILVPGGFGDRGIEAKILCAEYARKNGVPYFGICLGMQVAVIGALRNKYQGAHSTEFDSDTKYPVIDLMLDQKDIINLGGTMRLGSYACELNEGSLAYELYREKIIHERHRHRFEFNSKYEEDLKDFGLYISGRNPETGLTEIIESANADHFFVGVQFHPEFKSRPFSPSPFFVGFVTASLKQAEKRDS